LVQGEAQFSVARDSARPFIVRAGGVDVRAVGTAFNVKLAGASIELLVTEGTVHVAPAPTLLRGAADGVAPTPAAEFQASLSAGQRTIIPVASEGAAPVVLEASRDEVERLLLWKPRLLDFNATPLAEV